MSKGWTDERRKKQAENCRKTKPWTNATGPKTDEGKKRSAQNTYAHGMRSELVLDLSRLMTEQRRFIKELLSR
jgi:hypothetical protein